MKKYITAVFTLLVMVVSFSCENEIEKGLPEKLNAERSNNLSKISTSGYTPLLVHPGILQTTETIQSMRDVVNTADVNDPVYKTYLALKADYRAQSDYIIKGPFPFIARGGVDGGTKSKFEPDFGAAYLNALMWAVTQNEAHAAKSLEIMVKYADVLVGMTGPDQPLLAGFNGFQLAYALELLRYTYNVSDADFAKVNAMLRKCFLPVLEEFYVTPPYTNGNWGLAVTRSYLSFAILWNDVRMYKKGVNFFLNGFDNGTLSNYIDPLTGQCQESGREQAHAQLGLGQLGSICELAYHQGNDLYGLFNNAAMKAFEYTAKYNLGYDDVPFKTWKDVTGKYSNWTVIGSLYRGNFRSIYGMTYNHYVGRKGLRMPYTEELLRDRFPLGVYNGDGICFDVFQFCDGKLNN